MHVGFRGDGSVQSEFTAFLVRLALDYWGILGTDYKEGKADEIKSSYTALNQPNNSCHKIQSKNYVDEIILSISKTIVF